MDAKSHVRNLMKMLPVLALVILAAVVAVAVTGTRESMQSTTIATEDGRPKAWDSAKAGFARNNVSVALESKIVENDYVEYISSLENKSATDTYYLIGLSSFLDEKQGLAGFASFNNDNLEYTYTIENANSWKTLEIGEPSNRKEAFRLSESIELGVASSKTDTVYFRYRVLPNQTTSTMDETLTYLLENERGLQGQTTKTNTIAYTDLGNLDAPTAIADLSDIEEDSAYLAPLGVSSSQPSTALITTATASTKSEKINAFMDGFASTAIGIICVVVGGLILAWFAKKVFL